ncbi:MAG: hypothetical protein KJO79_11065 [Verrucomicrobiae bacterium]|nr:hypothetical protein [Verrucomicrobiae bacterium]NNJ87715.1 hypothetical protein [Akkermansiaceae bacterium]
MNVLALTILISVCLAAIFIVCFIGELRKPRKRGIEHHALMPLEDDQSTETASNHSLENKKISNK